MITCATFLLIATFASSNTPVIAQSPCIVQVSYPAISQNYNPNIGVTVPVSATCSYSGQLYAVGDAYDTTTNSDLGSVNTGLSSTGGGNFNGQLNFFLPTSAQSDTIQISVSIYNNPFGNNGSPLATTSQTLTLENGSYNQSYQNNYNNCQAGYSYVNGNCSPSNNNGSCPPGYSYDGTNCYPPNNSNYNNYNNSYSYCQPGPSYIGGNCSPSNNSGYYNSNNGYPSNNNNNGYCSPSNTYGGGNCYPPNYSYNNYNNYNSNNYNNNCQPGNSYGNSCYPPGYSNSYSNNYNNNYNNGYNNYYAYCPPGYSNTGSCSYPGNYYYSMYRSHGNYYYHWYFHHRHW